MDPVPFTIGVAIWAATLIFALLYRARLRRATFTSGTVTNVRERPDPEGLSWHPVIAYKAGISGTVEFEAGWSAGPKYWHIGQHVSVKIIDGKPELHDSDLVRTTIGSGIVFGLCLIASAYILGRMR